MTCLIWQYGTYVGEEAVVSSGRNSQEDRLTKGHSQVLVFSMIIDHGVSHYIIFVREYNYNYFLKNVIKYHYSTTIDNFKCNGYTTTILLLLLRLKNVSYYIISPKIVMDHYHYWLRNVVNTWNVVNTKTLPMIKCFTFLRLKYLANNF